MVKFKLQIEMGNIFGSACVCACVYECASACINYSSGLMWERCVAQELTIYKYILISVYFYSRKVAG